MLLRLFRALNLIFLGSLMVACATNTGGNLQVSNSIKSQGSWFLLTFSSAGDRSFFDPYQTTYDQDGNLQTVFWVAKTNGTQTGADLLKINCLQKMYQAYKVTGSGSWELYQDWQQPEANSVGMGWMSNLCEFRSVDGESLRFIGMAERQGFVGRYTYWYWAPYLTLQPSPKSGKTIKVFHLDSIDKKLNYNYVYVDCEKRKLAESLTLSLENLKWINEPAKTSPYGFFVNKFCGFRPVAQSSGTSARAPVQSRSVDIGDAKEKCAELGYKRGTEQFGTCVLKLTK